MRKVLKILMKHKNKKEGFFILFKLRILQKKNFHSSIHDGNGNDHHHSGFPFHGIQFWILIPIPMYHLIMEIKVGMGIIKFFSRFPFPFLLMKKITIPSMICNNRYQLFGKIFTKKVFRYFSVTFTPVGEIQKGRFQAVEKVD